MAEGDINIRIVTDAKNLNDLRAGLKQWQKELATADFGSAASKEAAQQVRNFQQAIKESGPNWNAYKAHMRDARQEKRALRFAIVELMEPLKAFGPEMAKVGTALQHATGAGLGMQFALGMMGKGAAAIATPVGIAVGFITLLAEILGKSEEKAKGAEEGIKKFGESLALLSPTGQKMSIAVIDKKLEDLKKEGEKFYRTVRVSEKETTLTGVLFKKEPIPSIKKDIDLYKELRDEAQKLLDKDKARDEILELSKPILEAGKNAYTKMKDEVERINKALDTQILSHQESLALVNKKAELELQMKRMRETSDETRKRLAEAEKKDNEQSQKFYDDQLKTIEETYAAGESTSRQYREQLKLLLSLYEGQVDTLGIRKALHKLDKEDETALLQTAEDRYKIGKLTTEEYLKQLRALKLSTTDAQTLLKIDEKINSVEKNRKDIVGGFVSAYHAGIGTIASDVDNWVTRAWERSFGNSETLLAKFVSSFTSALANMAVQIAAMALMEQILPSSWIAKLFPHAQGGWITEPVVGVGTRTGAVHTFGERGPEYVSPANAMGQSARFGGSDRQQPGSMKGSVTFQIRGLNLVGVYDANGRIRNQRLY